MSGGVLRLAGALLALSAGYGWGAARVEQARRHTQALDEMGRVLDFIRAAILYREMDSAEILHQLRAQMPLAWLCESGDTLCTVHPPTVLPPCQYAVFAECFAGLGRCGTQETVRRLDYCLARCTEFRACAGREEEKAKKLYRQAGLCLGALAVLFLL